MIAEGQPHLGKALPCLLLTKGGQRCFQLTSAGALEEMSSPYGNPPCGSLPIPQSRPAAPLLLNFPSPGADKSPSGKKGDSKKSTHWGWIFTPGPQGPISSPRNQHCHCCSWIGRAAAAARLVFPSGLTLALLLPSQGSGEDTLSPTKRDPALEHQSSSWSQRPWWSSHWFVSSGSAPAGPGFQ